MHPDHIAIVQILSRSIMAKTSEFQAKRLHFWQYQVVKNTAASDTVDGPCIATGLTSSQGIHSIDP
jgi:hypothetical protein